MLGWSKNRLPGEPDEYLALLEPAQKQVLLDLAAHSETPRVDASFARRLQNDLVPLLAATTTVATDPTMGMKSESGTEQAELHGQSRKVIRIWVFTQETQNGRTGPDITRVRPRRINRLHNARSIAETQQTLLQGRRGNNSCRRGLARKSLPLVEQKEKGFVLDDRPARRGTEGVINE